MNLPTDNEFEKKRIEFEQTKLAKKLEKAFAVKPYYQEYANRYLAALVSSYFFNLLSMLSAFTLVHFFIYNLVSNHIAAGLLTMVPLLLLEYFKRDAYSDTFRKKKQYGKAGFILVSYCLFLSAISVGGSYPGGKKMVHEFSKEYEGVNLDTLPEIIELKERIAELEIQKEQARGTKWLGTTTEESQKTVTLLTNQIVPLETELSGLRKEQRKNNSDNKEEYKRDTKIRAEYFALVAFFAELIYVLCMYYIITYQYNSFKEFSKTEEQQKTEETKGVAESNVDVDQTNRTNVSKDVSKNKEVTQIDEIEKQIKSLGKKMTTYNKRLKKQEVKPETYKKTMSRYEEEMKSLKQQRKQISKDTKLKAV